MTWRDDLLPASWRGVPFKVQAYSRSGGRRVAAHVYPQRDLPLVEDLGRKVQTFPVEGFILGDDYIEIRDALIEKLEGPGPGYPLKPAGTLIHPTYGTVRAICTDFRVHETTDEGRMARVSMEFIEAGEELAPSSRSRHVDQADAAASASAAESARVFQEEVEVAGVVEEARAPIESGLREFARRIRTLDVFGGRTADVAAVSDALTSIVTRTSELVTSPADLVGFVQASIQGIVASSSTAFGALAAYQSLFDFPVSTARGTGSQTLIANRNSQALRDLIVEGAVGGAVRAAARATFPALGDAIAARDAVLAEIDAFAATDDTDFLFAIEGLRRVFVNAVPPSDRDLPRIQTIELPKTTPALVLAFSLYDDATRDSELVDRNAIRHPLRLPGRQPLEALTR